MKIETTSNEKYFSLFIRFKIPFTKKTFRQHFLLYNSPETWVRGYSSRTMNGRYVLFHDYDELDLSTLEQELKYLQNRFKLSDYYVFELDRDNSFHAVCLDTFSLSEAYSIQKQSSCDKAFINSIKRLKTCEWVLRIGKKGEREAPKYVKTIKSDFNNHVKSTAHAEFLRKWGIKVSKKGEWDKSKILSIIEYDTANRTNKKLKL